MDVDNNQDQAEIVEVPAGEQPQNPPVPGIPGTEPEQPVGETVDPNHPLRSPGPKAHPDACLFLPLMPPTATDDKLKALMESTYGPVIKANVKLDTRKPYGFTHFLNLEDANKALNDPNPPMLDGSQISFKKSQVNTTIFLAKLANEDTTKELRAYGEKFGPVDYCSLLPNIETGRSRNCGFIKFVYRDDAKTALMGLQQYAPDWKGDWAKKDKEDAEVDQTKLYVGNLDADRVNEDLIRNKFQAYGPVEDIQLILPKDPNRQPRVAYSFIKFPNNDITKRIIEHENTKEWMGRNIRISFPQSEARRERVRENRRAQQQWSQQPPYPPPYGGYPPPPGGDQYGGYGGYSGGGGSGYPNYSYNPNPNQGGYSYPTAPAGNHNNPPPAAPSYGAAASGAGAWEDYYNQGGMKRQADAYPQYPAPDNKRARY